MDLVAQYDDPQLGSPPVIEHIVDCSGHSAVDMVLDGPELARVRQLQQAGAGGTAEAARRREALLRLREDALGSHVLSDLLTVLGLL